MNAPLDRTHRVFEAEGAPACPGMYSMVTVQLAPAAKVDPQVFEVIAKDFIERPASATCNGLRTRDCIFDRDF